jgi:hypothetical protein
MFSCLRNKITWKVTVTAVFALLLGLSLIACSQPDDPVSSANDAAKPVITQHPQNGAFNVETDDTFQLTVAAGVSDGGTLSYQWYKNASNSNTGGSPTGTNSASLTLNKTAYTRNGSYYFYVIVTNTNNTVSGDATAKVTSNVATVTVTGNPPAPAFNVPENLKGSWLAVNSGDEVYTVTDTLFSFRMNYYWNDEYTGTIVNHRADGAGAGYLTIEYISYVSNPASVGKFWVIHYKNLSSGSVLVSGAFNADDPDFGVNYTGGKATQEEAETAYTVDNEYFSDYSLLSKILTNGVWRDGELTAAIGSAEYAFYVETGKTYYVWWNDKFHGPTPKNKTVDIIASAKYSDEETYIFGGEGNAGVDVNWITPQSFIADRTASVTVIVDPYDADSIGTFAVAFSTVSIRPGAAVVKTITAGQWADDTIGVDDIHVYTINVTQGTEYRVWWNETGSGNGDGTKSANVQVQARYADDTIIFNDVADYASQWANSAWATPQSFTADKSGTVDLRVRPNSGLSGYNGSYGIVYSTGSTRPIKGSATLISVTPNGGPGTPTTALTLLFDNAIPGLSTSDITLNMPGLFGVTKGALSGEGPSYTLGVSSPMDGTVTVTVGSAILPIINPTREVTIYGDDSIIPSLVENQWAEGELQNVADIDWYKITVSAGTTYYVWCNERGSDGDGEKTGDVVLGAWRADGTNIFGNTNNTVDSTWTTPQTILSTTNGTVYVRVRSWGGTSTTYLGTYGVVYSTVNSRPAIIYPDDISVTLEVSADGGSGIPTTALTLVFSEAITNLSAADITLSINNPFGLTKGDLNGDGPSYTLGISSPMDGALTVTVGKRGYDISGSPATVNITGIGSITITPLVEGVWTDGEVPAANSVDWYSFTVSADTTYRIWWNDSNQGPTPKNKDGDVTVGAWYANGIQIFGDIDSGWTTPQSFTPIEDGIVNVKVVPFNGLLFFAGTYGIVFSTGDTRPEL